ncbi:serine/threonine-protein phosphatase 6 regulatory ankyrin repeat subunit C-like [Haliotis rufescens]|uniref:serine/threonine-protein phosphatase 6 regulatory ankyrin repeat subunit C-like n=1 Tax=Haliotis rufescens TaxID=6454 RepID=UPI00201ECD44|nr:serine/threonine-protein phosphatase 6 regulatory ankyrin repeat subunit C-like [Haliotis rufescens]XP_048243229.1 serine/threonine-protein phosphatase 6 regulatory ankyrin repeat subunit C-like [Haliotis rufescens]XP_048243230.1 serine/threonine-protein phosphatase 6 regulatory ankyrin repeat subunit C-like [Haliotis rufescens]
MEGNPDSRGYQMTGRLTEEAAELLRRTEQGRQPTATTAIQHNYSGPVSQVDLTNATNVSISVGEEGARGCLSQERYCQKLDLLKEYFVDIHALQTAQQLLEKHGHVSICGAPGDGKTSIALKICEAYQQKGYETLFVENIERFDVDTISKRQSHMLVVFDDMFGSVTFSSNLEKLHELFSALVDDLAKTAADTERDSKKKKDKQSKAKEQSNEETPIYRLKLVFTSRTYIWKEGCSRLHQYKVDLLKTEAVLDMTKDHLTVEEKKRMLRSFKSKHPKCDISEKDICSITDSKNNIFGFPLISRLFFTREVFQMHNVKFFNNPLTYLRGDLDAIVREESNRSAAILLLILCDGNLNLVSLQSGKSRNVKFDAVKNIVPCCTSIGVAKEITNFTGVYCTVEDHIASFSHPSIYDAAACAVGHLNIVLLLEHCSLKFLYERVRLGKSIQSSDIDDVSNMIYITPQLHQTVVDRLVEGIRQGCFIWTVKHPALRDERIASLLWTEINDNIVEIVEQKDRDSGECFLYLASLSESYFLFSKSLEVVGRQGDTSTELYDCVVGCVTHGKLKHLEHLVTVMSLQAGFNVEFSIRGKTLLIMAAKSGQSEVFNFLIHKGADISVTDWTGNTCLHHACESRSMALTRKVVEMCPVLLDSISFVGFTPAMLCARAGHLLILKFLKQKGADLTLTDWSLSDCLHLASENGNLSTVRFLISLKMFNVNKKETYLMQTSAMKAAQGGHYDVYHLLVSEGADLTLTDEYKRDCLMLACERGNISIVKHVLSMKTCDINRRGGEWKQTPVMMALEGEHYDVYHLLVSEGADLTLTAPYNRDCLNLALYGGNINIVKHVLSMKTWDINRRGGELKQTPIMMALEEGHYDVYHLLVSEGADLTLTDYQNRDCLMLACTRGNMNIVKHVLSMKTCDINRRQRGLKQTPIMMALEEGHDDVYHLLVSEGADLTLTDSQNRDCLMLACKRGNMNIVKHVLSMKTWDINRQGGELKQTPIMMALEGGHYDVYHLLVSEGADLTLTDYQNRDCLMLACKRGNMNIVKHVLSMKTWDINRQGGRLKQTTIMMALEEGHYDVYHLLVSEGADLTLTDLYERDCLMLACVGGDISIVKHVLSMKIWDINRRGGEWKQTPIMMALEGGHDDVYHLLVSEGADLTLTDYHNRDFLMLACKRGNINIVKHVLSMKTCDINRRGGGWKQTPVMMALEGGHDDVYHLLVSEGADLTLTDKYNTDCLMLACDHGNINIVKHVLSMKTCDINKLGGELKQTPIMKAFEGGHDDVCHLLVSEGADLTLTDYHNRDFLMLACAGGEIDIVKHVLSMKTCDINRWGGYVKQTPIMTAIEGGHYDVYHLLVSEGADLTLTDEYNRDCLMLACVGGNISIVKHVLSMKTLDINRRGGELKQTPIMMALAGGHDDVYHLLVSEGADLTLTDDDITD